MPAKPSTITAAEKRVIRAETKAFVRSLSKVQSDAKKARIAAVKKLRAAEREYSSAVARIDREVPKATKSIERRIAILAGRLGI